MIKIIKVMVMLCLALAAPAFAMASDYSLVVNGSFIYTDVPPSVEGTNILVPLRVVAESTGVAVQYFGSERMIILYRPGLEVKLWLDGYNCYKNGYPVVLASPPRLINDRTFVTRDQIEQLLDLNVYLNMQANAVVVQS